jgi:dipeptidyl aminopeptidase/acylaminoacyl peptidase
MRAGGTAAELVLYPGEDHHFLGKGSPSVREDAAQRIVDWLTSHIEREPAPLATEQGSEASQDARG